MERIKILHNKRSAALIQMQTPDMAEHAVNEQHVLNRIGADIYVNFSNKINEIKMPVDKGLPEDGLSKDFTYPHPAPNQYYGNFRDHPGSGGPFSGSGYVVSRILDSYLFFYYVVTTLHRATLHGAARRSLRHHLAPKKCAHGHSYALTFFDWFSGIGGDSKTYQIAGLGDPW